MRKWLYSVLVSSLISTGLCYAQDFSRYDTLEHERFHIEHPDIPSAKSDIYNELNFARMNPETYGKQIGISLEGYEPAEPLTVDWKLEVYAQRYAEWMLKNEKLEHSSMPFNESILWNYDICTSVAQFIIDKNVPNLSHRKHLLNRQDGLVGVGIASGWVGSWYRNYVIIITK